MKASWNDYGIDWVLMSDKDENIAIVLVHPDIIAYINRAKPPRDYMAQGLIFSLDKRAGLAEAKIEAEQVARSMGWEFELVPIDKLG